MASILDFAFYFCYQGLRKTKRSDPVDRAFTLVVHGLIYIQLLVISIFIRVTKIFSLHIDPFILFLSVIALQITVYYSLHTYYIKTKRYKLLIKNKYKKIDTHYSVDFIIIIFAYLLIIGMCSLAFFL